MGSRCLDGDVDWLNIFSRESDRSCVGAYGGRCKRDADIISFLGLSLRDGRSAQGEYAGGIVERCSDVAFQLCSQHSKFSAGGETSLAAEADGFWIDDKFRFDSLGRDVYNNIVCSLAL